MIRVVHPGSGSATLDCRNLYIIDCSFIGYWICKWLNKWICDTSVADPECIPDPAPGFFHPGSGSATLNLHRIYGKYFKQLSEI